MPEDAIFIFSMPGEVGVIKGGERHLKVISLYDEQGEEVFFIDHLGQHHYLTTMSRIARAWVRWLEGA